MKKVKLFPLIDIPNFIFFIFPFDSDFNFSQNQKKLKNFQINKLEIAQNKSLKLGGRR